MNELELVKRLTEDLATNDRVVAGAGDDCAVLDLGLADQLVLFKTDAVVEGIHFEPDAEAERVGHKALARCLSDIAAMGGEPESALVTIALPEGFDSGRVEAIYAGMNRLARCHGVSISGGETTTCPERMLISVSMLGRVPRERCILRSGALPGDALFVSGELGGSLAGRHLEFEPRLAEARWLVKHFEVHAMIDLSDGLASDLRHVLRASGRGGELLASALPVSRAARLAARSRGESPLSAALSDGEDYELLFCVSAADATQVLDQWKEAFPGVRLSCIGKITEGAGLVLRDRSGVRKLDDHGYVHFEKP